MEAKDPQRRYDLDWLRVLAFSGVFFYHCSRFFNTAGWHVKNAQTSSIVDIFTGIFDLFGMPLIFAISGASIFFALRPGGARRFLRERALRLLLPLGVGVLVLAPPQVYLDRLTHGLFKGTFLEFLPHYFQPANFSWNGVHLWYLQYLFVFTLLLMPLFMWLKQPSGQRALRYLSQFTERPGAIFIWAVPLALISIVVDPFSLMKPGLSETLLRLVMFPLPLVYGYLIYADHAIQQAIIRQRRAFLFLSVGFTFVPPLVSMGLTQWGWKINPRSYAMLMTLASLLIWCYLLAAFGYGMRYLTSAKRSLAYANEAVLPFYILHQPVILILGYFIIQLQLPIIVKYLIITPLALSITLMLYEYGIRRVNMVRRAFGLKPRQTDSTSVKVVTQLS
jgi:glucan biosynthesis protein C